MELTPTSGLRKREAGEPLVPTAPSTPPKQAVRGPGDFYEPRVGEPVGLETSFVLKGVGPDYIRLPYERLPSGAYGPDAAITRLISTLASIYESHPQVREDLRRAGFQYQGEELLAAEHHQEDREDPHDQEDRDPREDPRQEGGGEGGVQRA